MYSASSSPFFILIRGDGTVPSVVLGHSRDLSGRDSHWWSRRRLRWSRDSIHTVLSFAIALAFLALVDGYTAPLRFP